MHGAEKIACLPCQHLLFLADDRVVYQQRSSHLVAAKNPAWPWQSKLSQRTDAEPEAHTAVAQEVREAFLTPDALQSVVTLVAEPLSNHPEMSERVRPARNLRCC